MTFQIKSVRQKQKFSGKNFFKMLPVFFLAVICAFIFSFPDISRSLALEILSPFFKTGDFFYNNLGRVPVFFSDRNKLITENEKLLNELEDNHIEAADYESIKYENQRLRKELGVKPIGNFITASIIAKFPQIPLDSLILDKGIEDGVNDEDLVLVSERILVGKIAKASKNKATVILNSSVGAVFSGYVARTDEPLEVKGDGGGSIKSKVPIDFDITVGDKIMVDNSVAYLAAIVGVIEEDRSSGFKNVLMSLPVDISKINVAFVSHITSE